MTLDAGAPSSSRPHGSRASPAGTGLSGTGAAAGAILLLLELASLAAYLDLFVARAWIVSQGLGRGELHAGTADLLGLSPASLFLLALLGFLIIETILHVSAGSGGGLRTRLIAQHRNYLPLLALSLPVLLARGPASGALDIVVMLSLNGSYLLLALVGGVVIRQKREEIARACGRLRLPHRALGILLFGVTVLAYGWVAARSPEHVSGDEPSYLQAALSLLHDRDLDLRDNAGLPGLSKELEPHVSVSSVGGHGFPLHGIGPSILFLIPAVAAEALEPAALVPIAKQFMAVASALAALLYFGIFREITGSPRRAFLLSLAASLLPPLLFYATRLFYHPFVTLLLLWVILADLRRAGGGSGGRFLTASCVSIAVLPFLHVKLVFVSALLALYAAATLRGRKRVLHPAPLILFAAAFATLAAFNHAHYGSLSPFAMYAAEQRGMGPGGVLEGSLRAVTGLGKVLLDQRHGLLVIAPFYLLFPLALKGLRTWSFLRRYLFYLGLGLLVTLANTYHFWYLGWAPPQRPLHLLLSLLLVGLPFLIRAITDVWRAAAFVFLLSVSGLIGFAMASTDVLLYGNIYRHEGINDLLRLVSWPAVLDLSECLPAFRTGRPEEAEKAILFLLAFAGSALAFHLLGKARRLRAAAPVLASALLVLLLPAWGWTARTWLGLPRRQPTRGMLRQVTLQNLAGARLGVLAAREGIPVRRIRGGSAEGVPLYFNLSRYRLPREALNPEDDVLEASFPEAGPLAFRVPLRGAPRGSYAYRLDCFSPDPFTWGIGLWTGASPLGGRAGASEEFLGGAFSIDEAGDYDLRLSVDSYSRIFCDGVELEWRPPPVR